MKFYYYFANKNIWGRFDGKVVTELEPEEMAMMLSDDITEKSNEYIYMASLDGFLEDVIKTIYMSGFNFVTGNISTKKMKSGECKYLISGNETVYNFTFKNGKSLVRLYNLDNIIKMSPDKLSETFGSNENTIKDTMRGCYNAIQSFNNLCNAKRELPCTITGYAKRVFQRTTGAKNLYNLMNHKIGDISADKWIRASYHGGFNYINNNSGYIKEYDDGIVLDVNSLYPWIMATKPLPIGVPHYKEGKPSAQDIRDANNGYIYMFLKIKVSFKVKEDGIPCIKVDNGFPIWYLYQTDYMTTSQKINYRTGEAIGDYDKIELTLTQSDYKLLLANYDIFDIEYVGFVWFATTTCYFSEYVKRFYKLKKNAKTEGERFCHKMMLNSISGLMARLPEYENVIIDISDDGYFDFKFSKSQGNKSYINVGSAITAYGREFIINKAMKHKKRWLYTDADSLHLIGSKIPEDIKIGGEMGEFKVEKSFEKAIYYTKKCYGMISDNKLKLTMAGVRLDDTLNVEAIYNHTDRSNLVTAYDKQPLTPSEKNVLKGILYGDSGYDADAVRFCGELNRKLEENNNKKITFETNLNLMRVGCASFPMTRIYRNDMFSTDMVIEWGDFSERIKKKH